VELGQGVITSLPQMLADELDISVSRVDMIMSDTDLCPWDSGTSGSTSIRFFGPPLRQAAAEARAVLLELASKHLKVPKKRLTVKDGVVSDRSNIKKNITYEALTKGKYIEKRPAEVPPLKEVEEFKIMGKSYKSTDGFQKVTGKAQYTGDIRLPGMLYAKVLRPPVHGAKLKCIDTSALNGNPNLCVVKEKDFIAVLHPYPDVAEKAISQIKAEFDMPRSDLDNTTIYKYLLDAAPKEGRFVNVVTEGGIIREGEKLAVKSFESTYFNPYLAHAPIETHTATAKIDGDKVTVWASTQYPFPAKESVARALGISEKNVRIIVPFVGGAFGGKAFNHLQAIEAARLTKLTGQPVQVMWNRQEEFFNDDFRPAAIVKIRSGLDDAGKIVFWQYDVYYAGPRGAEPIYAIPHHKVVSYVSYTDTAGQDPFKTGPWRAPGANTNAFARESQIDIMAADKGIDPLEFRLNNLTNHRMLRTLKAAAEQFKWKWDKTFSGGGYGIACSIDSGTYVVTVAEVKVNIKNGRVKVKRILCAQDMGFVINPEGARLQIEGSLTMGLGYALTEEINFKGGKILNTNFDSYDIPRFSWLPKIETILIDNPSFAPQGGGEPPVTGVGAAISNAIFNATGARLYQMPLTPSRLKEALE
jgi:nicotinate dehydrogenase subunit B